MAHLDAASERLTEQAVAQVEAVRIGFVVAHNPTAYRRWQARQQRVGRQSHGLTGLSLERAVMGLAMRHPEYVIVEAA